MGLRGRSSGSSSSRDTLACGRISPLLHGGHVGVSWSGGLCARSTPLPQYSASKGKEHHKQSTCCPSLRHPILHAAWHDREGALTEEAGLEAWAAPNPHAVAYVGAAVSGA